MIKIGMIFREVISAFDYLEQNHILHRDIRPANILIDQNYNVKIIDFGFGKQLAGIKNDDKNSILLNWPATEMPDEVQLDQEYNEQTEIYFVGTLFRHLQSQEGMEDFRFQHIIEKMTKLNPTQRYTSFSEIANDISAGVLGEIVFTEKEKEVYRNFANALTSSISHFKVKYNPIKNTQVTLSKLAELIRQSSLEEYIQDNGLLIMCFVNNGLVYFPDRRIKVKTVIDFYELVTKLSPTKQKILFDNIFTRLSAIKIQDDDGLPF